MNVQVNLDNKIKNTQQLIHEAIVSLGGYWQPLSGLARLQEEIGELCELTIAPGDQSCTYLDILQNPSLHQAVVAELTDVFIISTCLANQYCISLDEGYKELPQYHQLTAKITGEETESTKDSFVYSKMAEIVSQAGQIARILNHYDGDKIKKKTEEKQTLAQEIVSLHQKLIFFAARLEVNLLENVKVVVSHNLTRDVERFKLTADPITEESRLRFMEVIDQCQLPYTRVWGAKKWIPSISVQENLKQSSITFKRLTKGGFNEGIEGVVIHIPNQDSNTEKLEQEISTWLTQFYKDRLSELVLQLKFYYVLDTPEGVTLLNKGEAQLADLYCFISISEERE